MLQPRLVQYLYLSDIFLFCFIILCIIHGFLLRCLQWLLLPPLLASPSGWSRRWPRATVQSWPAPRWWCQEVRESSNINNPYRNVTISLQSHLIFGDFFSNWCLLSPGRGLKSGENFKLLYDLADKMNAAGRTALMSCDNNHFVAWLELIFKANNVVFSSSRCIQSCGGRWVRSQRHAGRTDWKDCSTGKMPVSLKWLFRFLRHLLLLLRCSTDRSVAFD